MISDITNIDYTTLKNNITLKTNEIPIDNLDEKYKKTDFILEIGNNTLFNLELNKNNYEGLKIKNLSYVFKLYATKTKKGSKYNPNLRVGQVNINCYHEDVDPLMEYSILSKSHSNISYTNSFVIYSLNIYKGSEMYYNLLKKKEEIPNYLRWCAFIY